MRTLSVSNFLSVRQVRNVMRIVRSKKLATPNTPALVIKTIDLFKDMYNNVSFDRVS